MKEKAEMLLMSAGIGALMFGVLAVVVRWLRFAVLGSLPALVIVLVASVPVSAQSSLLGSVQAERAKYGASLTPSQVGQMLNAVAWAHRAEGWGLLRKGSGNSCPLGDTFISCDILIHAPSIKHFDVLIDSEGRAEPNWADAGTCVLSPSSGCEMSRFLAPIDPGGSPYVPVPTASTPPQVPVLTPAVLDYSRLEAVIREQIQVIQEQNERIRADELARDAQTLAAVQSVSAQVRNHDENPSWLTKVFSNRYVQLALAATGTYVGQRMAK
jgi:hypothetical protein